MILAHKIRLNPTGEQGTYFWRCAGVARFTWNWALAEYNRLNANGQKPNVLALKKEFNRLRRESDFAPFVAEVSTWANQYAFTDLLSAISRYFEFKKRGELKPPAGWKPRKDGKPFGWPQFKSRRKTTPAFGVANQGLRFDGNWVQIPRCPGLINMAEPLRFEGKVMAGRISYRAGHWYLAVQVEMGDMSLPAGAGAVGVDLGIKHLAVTSDGQIYENIKALRTQQRKLARLQRSMSRKEKDSQNWKKAKARIARLHARIADLRSETIHALTTDLTREYNVIGLEDLNVKGMMANHKLAQSIADASFNEIRRQLEYKTAMRSGRVVVIDRWYPSSKTCSACGVKVAEMPLNIRKWQCKECGTEHDRDVNAAINIRNEAVRMLEAA